MLAVPLRVFLRVQKSRKLWIRTECLLCKSGSAILVGAGAVAITVPGRTRELYPATPMLIQFTPVFLIR
jgi:hypothetical protein